MISASAILWGCTGDIRNPNVLAVITMAVCWPVPAVEPEYMGVFWVQILEINHAGISTGKAGVG